MFSLDNLKLPFTLPTSLHADGEQCYSCGGSWDGKNKNL